MIVGGKVLLDGNRVIYVAKANEVITTWERVENLPRIKWVARRDNGDFYARIGTIVIRVRDIDGKHVAVKLAKNLNQAAPGKRDMIKQAFRDLMRMLQP